MKKLVLLTTLLVPMLTKAQDIKEYQATNGVTYHLNDTVRLGKGSNNNGSFFFVEDRGAMGFINVPNPQGRSNGRGLQKEFANGALIVKSIKKIQAKNVDKYVFMVSGAGPFRYSMYIDDAISVCEVTPCKNSIEADRSSGPVASVADEIKKLKELMDSGAITKEEFEKRKKKLLDQ
ncbi:SHOCT domain-containing protein [Mucilaginibacter myungsuensis]|uniref:SHOCT domain-containing protein n=1 Tax=Mucilaginibacter myungsuensis TaxID=649104 RepID=A0A929KSW4_9SPHI|nr:SHOCT domain-containing protein [Mucilaginibacter myungsuensis]MBE9660552.1 SHOCT domain-containing protein [Mucilaginibacter myungsuensis]MDN3600597.1 SHOCT domain-containing protein [Mucilaginibacter myungsuensis]